jgi:hypothetical protein
VRSRKPFRTKAHELFTNPSTFCQTFIEFSRDRGIDPESSLSEWSPDEREKKQNLFSHAAKPTFDKLREYFAEDGSSDIVAEFDKGEEARAELERIRRGL